MNKKTENFCQPISSLGIIKTRSHVHVGTYVEYQRLSYVDNVSYETGDQAETKNPNVDEEAPKVVLNSRRVLQSEDEDVPRDLNGLKWVNSL